MRNQTAKSFLREAEKETVGQPTSSTRRVYQAKKVKHKRSNKYFHSQSN